MSIDRRRLSVLVLFLLAGGCTSILMFWITANGPGVTPDSVNFIETAQSLLAGNGFYAAGGWPMIHYAPGYPLLLAIAALFQDGNVLEAGRLLCGLLFGVNFVLFGIGVFICTERCLLATVCAMCVFLVSVPNISIHSMIMSEAPFITFTLAAFFLLSLHIVRPTLYLLLAASLGVGCAMATRYVGITLLPPVVYGLLFFGNRPLKYKIGDTILVAAVASLPLTSWFIRNILVAERATNRAFAVHPFAFEHAKQLIITMYDFVLPISISGWMKALHLVIVAALFLVSLLFLHRKNYIRRNANIINVILPALCIVFFLTYISFLVISISFFDALTPLDGRILLPAFLAISVAGISLAWSLSSALGSRIVWYGFILFVFFSVTINGAWAVTEAVDIHRNGRGFTSREWKNSKTIASVMSLAKGMKIYSNGPDVIQFFTGRTVTNIPYVTDPLTLEPNQDYEEQLKVICREVGEGKAFIVYLNGITFRWFLPTLKEVESDCVMPVLARLDDGVIYGRPRGKVN